MSRGKVGKRKSVKSTKSIYRRRHRAQMSEGFRLDEVYHETHATTSTKAQLNARIRAVAANNEENMFEMSKEERLAFQARYRANGGLVVVYAGSGVACGVDVLRAMGTRVRKLILVDRDGEKMNVARRKLEGAGVDVSFLVGSLEERATYDAVLIELDGKGVDLFLCDLCCSSVSGNRHDLAGCSGLEVDMESGQMLDAITVFVGQLSRRSVQTFPFALSIEEIVLPKADATYLLRRLSNILSYALRRQKFEISIGFDAAGFRRVRESRLVQARLAVQSYNDPGAAFFCAQTRRRMRVSSSAHPPVWQAPAKVCVQDYLGNDPAAMPLECNLHTVTKICRPTLDPTQQLKSYFDVLHRGKEYKRKNLLIYQADLNRYAHIDACAVALMSGHRPEDFINELGGPNSEVVLQLGWIGEGYNNYLELAKFQWLWKLAPEPVQQKDPWYRPLPTLPSGALSCPHCVALTPIRASFFIDKKVRRAFTVEGKPQPFEGVVEAYVGFGRVLNVFPVTSKPRRIQYDANIFLVRYKVDRATEELTLADIIRYIV
ncbi:hypothetical protein M885DRAFT_550181 [Pelagophyceae sp. CCMP2097]|nr:hypothetical protein M885DRAFT_550181 [Pelagophyceae sp. CCMP2097]